MALSDIVRKSQINAVGEFNTRPQDDVSAQCDIIRQILKNAGWKDAGSTQATAAMSFPLGFPVSTTAGGGGLDVTNRLAAVYGPPNTPPLTFIFYDPLIGEPDPTNIDPAHGIMVVGVPIGASGGETATRLANKMGLSIWSTGIVNAPIIGAVGITFQSLLAGTEGNNFNFQGSGSTSTGSGNSEGGGWILESSTQQKADLDAGVSPASVNTTKTTLLVRNGASGQHNLLIQVTVTGLSTFDFIGQQGKWVMWANPFCARFDSTDTPYHAGDTHVGNALLWCGSLSLPSELDLNPVGFILGPGFGVVNSLGEGNAFGIAQTVAGSKTHSGFMSQNGFAWAYYHYQNGLGSGIQTRMGKSLLLPAITMMPVTALPSDEARLVGYWWDAFIETNYHKPGTIIVQEGEPYRAVAAQSGGAVGTLWLRWPVRPPDPGVTEPVPLPDFVGTCNVISNAAVGGVFDGALVNRLTGSPFTQDLVGRALYINGIPYKVRSVQSADFLTLEVDVPANIGNVAFHT